MACSTILIPMLSTGIRVLFHEPSRKPHPKGFTSYDTVAVYLSRYAKCPNYDNLQAVVCVRGMKPLDKYRTELFFEKQNQNQSERPLLEPFLDFALMAGS